MNALVQAAPATVCRIEARPAMRRLLIPIKCANDAAPAMAYTIRRHAEGIPVEVALLHVEALAAPWPIKGDGQYVRAQRRPRSAGLFGDCLRILDGLQIEHSTHFATGPLVFSILDAAEQLACTEIVVPAPGRLHLRCLSQNVVATLQAWQRGIPVIAVNKRGIRP